MLSIQPKISNSFNPAFKMADRKIVNEENDFDPYIDEDTYERTKDELEEQKREFEDLADNDELKLPKTAKKIIKGGAIVTTSLLGGMATGWGAKKSIGAFQKLGKTDAIKGLNKQIKATNEFLKKAGTTVKTEFLKSDAYKLPKAKFEKFAKTKFGKPVTKFFGAIGKGISYVWGKTKSAYNFVYKKITNVKKETYEKATVNVVGASGGIASGVTAIKENSEKGKE